MTIHELLEKKTCLLCKERKVYEIKSHLTPAGITKNTYGERYKEEIYTINPKTKKIETYFGSEHPQTENRELKDAPNVRKGIFCKECEFNLGKYESLCQTKLNSIINLLGKGGYKIQHTNSGNKTIDVGVNVNILTIFFLSVIWRQCIEQILNVDESPLEYNELENLRLFILKYLKIEIRDIVKIETLIFRKLSIHTTYNTKTNSVATYASPHSTKSNPELFFIGPIILLYWKLNEESKNIMDVIMNSIDISDKQLNLENGIIGVISNTNWKKITFNNAKNTVKMYMN